MTTDLENLLALALCEAMKALNTAPRFKVPSSVHGDSYKVASECERVLKVYAQTRDAQ
jgi:hypothetical protein